MAFFDTFKNPMDNEANALAAQVNPSSGGFFDGMNVFGTSIPTGILDSAQEEKLRKQALTQGLLGTLATYVATPKNLGAGSALPYLGKAFLGGMGASQDVVDRTLNNAYRQQLLAGRGDNLYNVDGALVDRTGKVVYQGAAKEKDRKTAVVGGVLVDANTGEKIFEAPQKPESLYKPEVSAEGKVFFIPQKPNMPILDDKGNKVDNANLSTKPPTGEQSNAYVYSNRMESADKILNKLDGKYDPFLISIKTSGTTSLIPGGQTLANKALSASDQRAEQAQRNFINAVLRRESGAVISPSEFENASLQYFPQAGDTSEVKIQKASNRRLAIDDLKRISGKSYNAQSQSSVVNFEDLK